MMHFIASDSSVCFPYPKEDFFFSQNEIDIFLSPIVLDDKIQHEITVF